MYKGNEVDFVAAGKTSSMTHILFFFNRGLERDYLGDLVNIRLYNFCSTNKDIILDGL